MYQGKVPLEVPMFIRCIYHGSLISLLKWLELEEKKLEDLFCEKEDYVIEKRTQREKY